MVERTPRGREVRRYFIDCERQLNQSQQPKTPSLPLQPVALTRAERQAINRQAWADVANQCQVAFHARREALIQQCAETKKAGPVFLPEGSRHPWAQRGIR